MSDETEMVSVPRELAQELDDLLYILTGHDSHPKMIRKYGEEFWVALDKLRNPLCKAIAAPPEDVRAVVDEPVHQVRSHGSGCWEDVSGESLESCRCQPEHYEIRKLHRQPQRQMVLPERMKAPSLAPQLNAYAVIHAAAWNACLDKIAELNK